VFDVKFDVAFDVEFDTLSSAASVARWPQAIR
jgi:hypothetical protein